MEIEKIDKNFVVLKRSIIKSDIYQIPHKMFDLYGVFYDENHGFLRMPYEEAKKVSDNIAWLNRHTAGGRLVFRTNSQFMTFNVRYDSLDAMSHMAFTGLAGFSLCEKTPKGERFVTSFGPSISDLKGYTRTTRSLKNRGKTKTYVLHFPLYNGVTELSIELVKGSVLEKPEKYQEIDPIIFYGSSITQGGCASRADTSYEDFSLKDLNLNYINLGFSGNAKGHLEMAKYIGSLKCSCLVYDYDENAPDYEFLNKTHETFFKKFRKFQPATPVIFMTKSNYYSTKDDKMRFKIIKNTYENAIKSGDNNVYFIDGRKIFPSEIRNHCTVDGVHPTDLGFYYMSKKLKPIFKKIFEIKNNY